MVRRNRNLTIVRASALTRFVISLVVVPSAAFGAGLPRQFAGTTSQSTPTSSFHITVDVSATKVDDLVVTALVVKGSAACSLNSVDGTSFDFTSGSLAIVGHRIAGTLKDALGDAVAVHARVSKTSIIGSLLVRSVGSTATGPCNSGVVTFSALSGSAPVGTTAYSGTVGPGWLITFDVSARATTVTNLVVAYDETCNGPPSDVTPTFRFKTLTITSGEFTGTTFESFGLAQSDTVHIAGTFSGGVAAGQVSDTSRIKGLPTCTQTSPFEATAT
jgi:hypothetical protein